MRNRFKFLLCLMLLTSLRLVGQSDSYESYYDAFSSGKYKKAKKVLKEISKDKEDAFFVLIKKAELFAVNQEWDSCAYYYYKADVVQKTTVYFSKSNTRESILEVYETELDNYDKMIEANPNNPTYLNNRATVLLKFSRFEEAIRDYTKSLQFEEDYLIYYNRAICKSEINELDSAVIDFNKSLELNAKFGSAWLNRGFTYLEMGKYEEAISDLEKSIVLTESLLEQSYSYNNIGYAHYMLENYERALININHSLKINPFNSYAYRNLALLEIKEENYNSACESIKKGIELGFSQDYGDELEDLLEKYCSQN